jgi:hypothetical protein
MKLQMVSLDIDKHHLSRSYSFASSDDVMMLSFNPPTEMPVIVPVPLIAIAMAQTIVQT